MMIDEKELLERFNERVFLNETFLQLHLLRYEATERSFELLAKSAITLNGGALLAIITAETVFNNSVNRLEFALWFVLGCVVFLFSALLRYNAKRLLMETPLTYFPIAKSTSDINKPSRLGAKQQSQIAIFFLSVSIISFSVGCLHAYCLLGYQR